MPVRGVIGTDYMRVRPEFKIIRNPYGEDDILVVPAVIPDVSLIHAFRADRFGNCILNSGTDDALLARASARVIVSAEEIVDTAELKATHRGNFVSRIHIDAVVHMPGGAFPTSCGTLYNYNMDELNGYLRAAKDTASFPEFLEAFCRRLQNGGDFS
jgi:glutaconate CoA-transferase, subunit A